MVNNEDIRLYEYMGEPVKSICLSWIEGTKDPATDPRWLRRQRMKRIGKKILSIFSKVAIIVLVGIIIRKGTDVYKAYERRKK